MIDIDFIIFSYLPTREILRIFEFYFQGHKITNKKTLNLKLGNKLLITEIGQKYPVIVKCQHSIDPEEIDWVWLYANPEAIELLEANLENIDWRYLSKNPKAIHLLEAII